MEDKEFRAYVVEEKNGTFKGLVKSKLMSELPEGDLLIKVHYSSLNYKDALSAIGNKGVTKKYPHTPGIDAVGIVELSKAKKFKPGDKVIVQCYDLGMNTDGGFGQYIRVPSDWAFMLPGNLTMKESMTLGTAGLTAGILVMNLSEKIKPEDGKIVVSGATGGVGSLSITILSKLGYEVSAITGKEQESGYLMDLGASEVILRKDFEALDNKPLLRVEFAGSIDTVGGIILQNIIKSVKPMGVVTCCGNAASPKLELTVYPFILRGISLIGIDAQNYPLADREMVWKKLSNEWKPNQLDKTGTEITLEELGEKIDLMLRGKIKGRTVLNME